MRRKIGLLTLILAVALLLTSCTGVLADPESLISPPKADGELQGIEEALYAAVGKDFSFIYPSAGENRSSCISVDLNGDSKNEAIVFYRLKNDSSMIHMNFFAENDGAWKSAFETQFACSGLDRVDFQDVCGDKNLEIMVGCNMYSATDKQLNIFTLAGNTLSLLSQENYSSYSIVDIMENVKPQILLLSIQTQVAVKEESNLQDASNVQKSAFARLLTFGDQNTVVETGRVELDPNITGFSNITTGLLNDSDKAIYVDANKGSDLMITEILYFDNTLINASYDATLGETRETKREAPILCRDIDQDGRIEIPSAQVIKGYTDKAIGERNYYTIWRSYDKTGFQMKSAGVLNAVDGYYLNLEKDIDWLESITFVSDTGLKTRTFYDWNFDESKAGDELFTIKVFTKRAWQSEDNDDYKVVTVSGDNVYTVNINEKNTSSYQMTLTQIKDHFVLL